MAEGYYKVEPALFNLEEHKKNIKQCMYVVKVTCEINVK